MTSERRDVKPDSATLREWVENPMAEPCANCGRPRREHRMGRSIVCANGRRFQPTVDRKLLERYLFETETPDGAA